jgi:hypothetical protein
LLSLSWFLDFAKVSTGTLGVEASEPTAMELSEFLSNLSHVGSSPYAFAAYIAVVAAWVYTTVARHRLSKVGRLLKELPPDERTQLILREYSSAPRRGLSAEQWIKSRQHLLLFLAFLSLVVCMTLIIIIALVGSVTPNRTGDKSAELSGTFGTVLGMQTELKTLRAEVAKLEETLTSLQAADAGLRLVALMEQLYRKYEVPDTNMELIFSARYLTPEQKITLSRDSLIRKINQDIEDQANHINRLQHALADKSPLVDGATIDVETMKLKRLLDKRSQMVDLLNQIIDKYKQTSMGIIDAIGR